MTHRIPLAKADASANMTGLIDPAYQAEVNRSTHRGEVAYREAERRLQQAERQAASAHLAVERAKQARVRREAEREERIAWERVQMRREELAELAAMMVWSPASATHRGDRSFRPVPPTHGNLF